MSRSHGNGTTFRSRSSDHVPVVPTMVSHPVGVKRIHVFRNGDVFFQGIQVVVNTHRVPSINVLLDVISERIGLINGAKKLYTTSGTLVKDINRIRDGDNYVASSSHFTPMAYGGEQTKRQEKKTLTKTKKKKRSKTVDVREREKEKEMDEVMIPLNVEVEKEEEKKKKKKKKKTSRKRTEHHGSNETLETAEVELPSEIEDSEEEEEEDRHEDTRSRGKTPSSDHRPPTGLPPRSASRRGSRKDDVLHEKQHAEEAEKKKEEKRRKSISTKTRRKSHSKQHRGGELEQPNWGDLSSFTKNIESLLKN